jgi:hypothetical protein
MNIAQAIIYPWPGKQRKGKKLSRNQIPLTIQLHLNPFYYLYCQGQLLYLFFLLHFPYARNPVCQWISNTVAISESEPPIRSITLLFLWREIEEIEN